MLALNAVFIDALLVEVLPLLVVVGTSSTLFGPSTLDIL
jgi:hypothetical protein